jgi:hypothetical protein
MAAEVLEFAPLVGEVPAYEYPESDGEPMGDDDTQIELMILLRQALRRLFAGQQVYISANVFWYPVHGQPGIRTAPDLIVAFGRPPGNRGSYREWDEDGVTPRSSPRSSRPPTGRRSWPRSSPGTTASGWRSTGSATRPS